MTVASNDTAQRVLVRTITAGMSLYGLARAFGSWVRIPVIFGVKSLVFKGQILRRDIHVKEVYNSASLQTR